MIPAANDVSVRLVAILAAVTQLIFARLPVFAALATPLHNRIARASRRLATLLARLANGTFRPRPHTPSPGRKGGPPSIQLPLHPQRRPRHLPILRFGPKTKPA